MFLLTQMYLTTDAFYTGSLKEFERFEVEEDEMVWFRVVFEIAR